MDKIILLRNFLVCCFVLLLVASCSNIETIETLDESGRVIERFFQDKRTGKREGKYEAFYPNGNLKEVCFYHNDTLQGQRKLFYENGQLQILENYVNGAFEGLYQMYFQNGQLSNEGIYHQNEMTGIWKRWYETGELREEVTFKHNLENGPYTFYHKNGQDSIKGHFIQGDNDHGEVLKFDESGKLYEKMYCYWGVCATTWSAEKGHIQIDTNKIIELGDQNRMIIERELQQ